MNGKQLRREVLSSLNVYEWRHGIEIRKEIEEKTGREIHQPQIYSALVRLEAQGLLESKLEHEGTKRQRRLYRKKAGGKKVKRSFSLRGFFGWNPKAA